MKIAVIGAGFTGLATSLKLAESGHEVVVFEKDENPGGLAVGFRKKNWEWSLEKHYHHWFTNDKTVLNLSRKINYPVIIKRPKTSTLINSGVYQLDSPFTLLTFPLLNFIEKIRMGFALGFLKFSPFLKSFDKYKSSEILPKIMGKKGYEMIWDPLFKGKFGDYSREISLAWFWARIKKRTSSLAYPKGGFLEFSKFLEKKVKEKKGEFYYDTEVKEVNIDHGKPQIKFQKNGKTEIQTFDKVIVTIPSFSFLKVIKDLPENYKKQISNTKNLGATNLLLRLKKQFLIDGTYWLNVCESNNPLMAVVEHTNFMDKKYYNNEHLVYVGHYVPQAHPYFSMTKEDLLKELKPYLKKLNKDFLENLIDFELFKAPFAQPVMTVGYGGKLPGFKTPLENVYLANIQQVYPWDRGTNYAVELGEKVAKLITSDE